MNPSVRVQSLLLGATFATCAAALSSVADASIMLYENDNFSGRSVRATNSVPNLADIGFNDRASSVNVDSGRWQICSDAYFRGSCVTLGPGRYPTLRAMGLNDRLSSIRELGWTPDGSGGWTPGPNPGGVAPGGGWNSPPPGGNWGSGARVILYSGIGLSGQPYVVEPRGVRDLSRAGFNDRAASLRVEGGYWVFCSDANFEGDCRTYGPGDYPALPGNQAYRISSGRQISREYPYRQNPVWRD